MYLYLYTLHNNLKKIFQAYFNFFVSHERAFVSRKNKTCIESTI